MSTAASRIDLVTKLLARALDPSAMEGEAVNSATKMVQIARREAVTLPVLLNALAIARPAIDIIRPVEPVEFHIEMPFGKYRGISLGDIARKNPGYLKWCSETFDDDIIREAAGTVWQWFQESMGAR